MGATYAGHALGCAAALATITIYKEDNLIENSRKMGGYLIELCNEKIAKHKCIGDIRGKGLFVGLELVKNKKTKEPLVKHEQRVTKEMNAKKKLAKKLMELGMIAMV